MTLASTEGCLALSPEQHFRLRVARNDLRQAFALELAVASALELGQLLGALRSSLANTLAVIDQLVGDGEATE